MTTQATTTEKAIATQNLSILSAAATAHIDPPRVAIFALALAEQIQSGTYDADALRQYMETYERPAGVGHDIEAAVRLWRRWWAGQNGASVGSFGIGFPSVAVCMTETERAMLGVLCISEEMVEHDAP